MAYLQSLVITAPPGVRYASRVSSVGAAWADITPTGANPLTAMDGSTLLATDRYGQAVLKNTHATQDLFVLLRAGGATATTAAHKLGPGDTFSYDIAAIGTSTISLQGSGAATTYVLFASLYGAP